MKGLLKLTNSHKDSHVTTRAMPPPPSVTACHVCGVLFVLSVSPQLSLSSTMILPPQSICTMVDVFSALVVPPDTDINLGQRLFSIAPDLIENQPRPECGSLNATTTGSS